MDLKALRNEFPAAINSTYLDIAYDCGGANFSKLAASRFFDDWGKAAYNNERGGPGRQTLFNTIDQTRIMINELIHGEGIDQIAFTKNTNEGINAIVQSFLWNKGDNLVTNALEHQSVIMPCLNIKSKGVEVRISTKVEDGHVSLEDLQALCDKHTRMIVISHVQSATGTLLDLSILGPWCKERGIFLVVDAIQSLGIIPFDAQKWQIDAVSAGAYKGLLGVNCVAFTYYSKALLSKLRPVYIAAGPYESINRDTLELECKDETKARKMENSTVDALGIYVLHDALKVIHEIGEKVITDYIFTLYNQLYNGLDELGFDLVQGKEESHANVLTIRAKEPKALFDYFRSHNICLSLNSNQYIRLSLGAFNNQEDIDTLLDAARKTTLR